MDFQPDGVLEKTKKPGKAHPYKGDAQLIVACIGWQLIRILSLESMAPLQESTRNWLLITALPYFWVMKA